MYESLLTPSSTNNTYSDGLQNDYFLMASESDDGNFTLVEGDSEADDNAYIDYEDNIYNDDINTFDSFRYDFSY